MVRAFGFRSGFGLDFWPGFWLKTDVETMCMRSALAKRFACAQLKIPLELLKIQLKFPPKNSLVARSRSSSNKAQSRKQNR